MPAHTYLQSDDEDIPPEPSAPPEDATPAANPPPTNVWATLALQTGALRDLADGCNLLKVPAPARLVTLLLREMTEGLAGPDPLSEDFDWSQVPGGARPTKGRCSADRWCVVDPVPGGADRFLFTHHAATASVCYAAGYEVVPVDRT